MSRYFFILWGCDPLRDALRRSGREPFSLIIPMAQALLIDYWLFTIDYWNWDSSASLQNRYYFKQISRLRSIWRFCQLVTLGKWVVIHTFGDIRYFIRKPYIHSHLKKNMKKRIIIATLIVAGIHFVMSLGAICISYVSGMETFDNPEHQLSLFEKASHSFCRILLQPGLLFWTPWMSKHLPNFVEWFFFGCNSLLWGFVIALLINVKNIINKKEISNNKAVEATS